MARKPEATETSLPHCASCACDVGKEAGKIPFNCDDGGGGAGSKHEAFCPRCFVHVRALREQDRFRPGMFAAVKCTACGLETVAIGVVACGHCRSPRVIELPAVFGVA